MYQQIRNSLYICRTEDGATIPNDPSNADYAAYLQWLEDGNEAEVDPVPLEQLKAAKLLEINGKASAIASLFTEGYPDFEMKTWPQQEAESVAWSVNPAAATPMIDVMANARGINRELYLQKTLGKVATFRAASSMLVGLRQKYVDQLTAAETAEEVEAIDPIYALG
jgi:hypothetical protein